MVSAGRFNYLLFMALGIFWILSGIYYLMGGSGAFAFRMFGIRIENFHVAFGVFEVVFGLSWLYIITSRYDGRVPITS